MVSRIYKGAGACMRCSSMVHVRWVARRLASYYSGEVARTMRRPGETEKGLQMVNYCYHVLTVLSYDTQIAAA